MLAGTLANNACSAPQATVASQSRARQTSPSGQAMGDDGGLGARERYFYISQGLMGRQQQGAGGGQARAVGNDKWVVIVRKHWGNLSAICLPKVYAHNLGQMLTKLNSCTIYGDRAVHCSHTAHTVICACVLHDV